MQPRGFIFHYGFWGGILFKSGGVLSIQNKLFNLSLSLAVHTIHSFFIDLKLLKLVHCLNSKRLILLLLGLGGDVFEMGLFCFKSNLILGLH